MIVTSNSQNRCVQHFQHFMHWLGVTAYLSSMDGKKKAWKVLQSIWGSSDAPSLTSLGANNVQVAIPVARKLVSLIYDPQGKHRLAHANLNQLREKTASADSVSVHKLPPSKPAFLEHVQRAAFLCHIWMSAGQSKLDKPSSNGNRWHHQPGIFQTIYTEGHTIVKMWIELGCSCRGNEPCTNNCTSTKNELSCTVYTQWKRMWQQAYTEWQW